MLKTKLEKRPMTLFTVLHNSKDWWGFDICDDMWDCGEYFDCPKSFEECEGDAYFEYMLLLALNIKVVEYRPDFYTICKITDFINDNKAAYTKFFNENNVAGYRPKDYTREEVKKGSQDEAYYDAYIVGFFSLARGDYSEEQYRELINLFSKRG